MGVARPWNGRLGKGDHGQVSVWAALVRGDRVSPVGVRLDLPAEWTDAPPRCASAGVPPAQQVFRSQSPLALELVREARQRGPRFGWVGIDGGYGKEPAFLRALDASGEEFVADIHKDQRVSLTAPCPHVPAAPPRRGGRVPRRQAQSPSVRVDRWAAAQPAEAWQPLPLRDSTKGVLEVEVLHARVWGGRSGSPGPLLALGGAAGSSHAPGIQVGFEPRPGRHVVAGAGATPGAALLGGTDF